MKKFKCLTAMVLFFAMILSGVNVCSAVWFPKHSEAKEFLATEGISFEYFTRKDIADIIIGAEGRSPVIDFILRADDTRGADVINFVRAKLGCRYIDDESIKQLISGAAEKFRKDHSKSLDRVLHSKDATSAVARAFAGEKRVDNEADIKKLFIYIVMLEKCDLQEYNKNTALKAINALLGNVFADIMAHDKDAQVAKEAAEKVDEMDSRMTACERKIDKLQRKQDQQGSRLDDIDENVAEIQCRLDQFEARMKDFETIESESIMPMKNITESMLAELERTGKFDEKNFDKLICIFDKLATELAANRDLSERFVELSSRVSNIRRFAKKVAVRMDIADDRLDDMQNAVHRHSDRMVVLEQQRGDMQNTLEKVITDVQAATTDYHTYIGGYLKGYFKERKQELRDAYNRADFWQKSRMRDVYPDLFKEEEK